ncbi:hypothetical protein F4814DRAFT_405856 [Daldinia grandis]|nr:hypothetical protein F4814DRAFT_405856 [Daldinia grandis]
MIAAAVSLCQVMLNPMLIWGLSKAQMLILPRLGKYASKKCKYNGSKVQKKKGNSQYWAMIWVKLFVLNVLVI